MANEPLGIRDYLDASTDAAKRTRTITIVLVVASVLAFMALLNSLQSQWMHRRMLKIGKMRDSYVVSKLGDYPKQTDFSDERSYTHEVELYEHRYKELCAAVERAYVESSFVVRVPFLGFAFDVNDLGLIAGIGFIVILSCNRFFLSREVDNLRLSYEAAKRIGETEVEEFYILLAMRQVFTVPQTERIKRTFFLMGAPKLLTWLPLVIYSAVTWNDHKTKMIGDSLEKTRYQVLQNSEIFVLFILAWLCYSVTLRLLRMDAVWDEWWKHINTKRKAAAK